MIGLQSREGNITEVVCDERSLLARQQQWLREVFPMLDSFKTWITWSESLPLQPTAKLTFHLLYLMLRVTRYRSDICMMIYCVWAEETLTSPTSKRWSRQKLRCHCIYLHATGQAESFSAVSLSTKSVLGSCSPPGLASKHLTHDFVAGAFFYAIQTIA